MAKVLPKHAAATTRDQRHPSPANRPSWLSLPAEMLDAIQSQQSGSLARLAVIIPGLLDLLLQHVDFGSAMSRSTPDSFSSWCCQCSDRDTGEDQTTLLLPKEGATASPENRLAQRGLDVGLHVSGHSHAHSNHGVQPDESISRPPCCPRWRLTCRWDGRFSTARLKTRRSGIRIGSTWSWRRPCPVWFCVRALSSSLICLILSCRRAHKFCRSQPCSRWRAADAQDAR